MDEYPSSSNSAGSIIFPFSPFSSSVANSDTFFNDDIDADLSANFGSDFIIDEPPDWLNFYSIPAHPPSLPPPPHPSSSSFSSSSSFLLRDSADLSQELMAFSDSFSRNYHAPFSRDHHHHHHHHHHLSPPRMHPNLVTTLKSILSPVKKPSNQVLKPNQGETRADRGEIKAEQEETRPNQGKIRADLGETKAINPESKLMGDANSAGSVMGSAKLATVVDEDDDPTVATVVSLDLIKNRRPFTCSYEGCNKTFKNPQTMKMHFKTHYPGTDVCKLQRKNPSLDPAANGNGPAKGPGHNKKIPSRCPLCRKTFVGLYELRRHFGRKHSDGEKSHACRKCGKKFYIEVDLRDHEKLCGEPIKCKCGMKFAFKCNLAAHKKAHLECQDVVVTHHHLNPLQSPSTLGLGLLKSNVASHASNMNPHLSRPIRQPPNNPARSTGNNKLSLKSPFNMMSSNSSTMAPLVDFPQLYKPLGDITNNIR